MKKKMSKILLVLLTSIFVTGCSLDLKSDKPIENGMIQENVQLNDIPEFSNEPYTVLNGNVPLFTDEEIALKLGISRRALYGIKPNAYFRIAIWSHQVAYIKESTYEFIFNYAGLYERLK